mmetsp:Transcript_29198/g.69523  ORF Transcript_29198/g.69523 Transcript_29198/m.69523 type:complete len:126 (+) Transcript_29198:1020-1397(+)
MKRVKQIAPILTALICLLSQLVVIVRVPLPVTDDRCQLARLFVDATMLSVKEKSDFRFRAGTRWTSNWARAWSVVVTMTSLPLSLHHHHAQGDQRSKNPTRVSMSDSDRFLAACGVKRVLLLDPW